MLRFHNRNQVQNTVFKKKVFLYTSELERLGAQKTEKMSFGKKGHGFEEFLDIIEAQRFFTFLKTVDFLGFRTSDSGSRENRNLEQIVGGVITTNHITVYRFPYVFHLF